MHQKIFISYSRVDGDFAIRLDHDLDKAGFDAFLDQNDIPPGTRWDKTIEQALKESTTVVMVLSPASVSSENVLDEVGYALGAGKRVIPVRYLPCDVPMRISRLHYIDFIGGYEAGLAQLMTTLGGDTPAPPPPPPPGLPRSRVLLPAALVALALLSGGGVWGWRLLNPKVKVPTNPVRPQPQPRPPLPMPQPPSKPVPVPQPQPKPVQQWQPKPAPKHPATASHPAFECSRKNLPECCRDSSNPDECRKCKKSLDLIDHCD